MPHDQGACPRCSVRIEEHGVYARGERGHVQFNVTGSVFRQVRGHAYAPQRIDNSNAKRSFDIVLKYHPIPGRIGKTLGQAKSGLFWIECRFKR